MERDRKQYSKSIVVAQHPSRQFSKLHEKLASTLCNLRQSRASFVSLKAEIIKGLAEGKEVFASISVPLMKLVDLKVEQMEKDGRSSSVFFTSIIETQSTFLVDNDQLHRSLWRSKRFLLENSKESHRDKAACYAKEIIKREQRQVKQLCSVIKLIEGLVRGQERDIYEKFGDNQEFVGKMQNKFLSEMRKLHLKVQSMVNDYESLQNGSKPDLQFIHAQAFKALFTMVMKLQEAVFERFKNNLLQLRDEMDEVVNRLATDICRPLILCLKSLKMDGVVPLVKELRSLVGQVESELVQQLGMLVASTERLIIQLRNTEMLLNEREGNLQKTVQNYKALSKSMDAKHEENAVLAMALARKESENEELRNHLNRQCKKIDQLQKERSHLLDQQKQMVGIQRERDEGLQKIEDLKRKLSATLAENTKLQKIGKNRKVSTSEGVVNASQIAGSIESWVNMAFKRKVHENTSTGKEVEELMKLVEVKLKELISEKSTKLNNLKSPISKVYRTPSVSKVEQRQSSHDEFYKEDRLGDDFLGNALGSRKTVAGMSANGVKKSLLEGPRLRDNELKRTNEMYKLSSPASCIHSKGQDRVESPKMKGPVPRSISSQTQKQMQSSFASSTISPRLSTSPVMNGFSPSSSSLPSSYKAVKNSPLEGPRMMDNRLKRTNDKYNFSSTTSHVQSKGQDCFAFPKMEGPILRSFSSQSQNQTQSPLTSLRTSPHLSTLPVMNGFSPSSSSLPWTLRSMTKSYSPVPSPSTTQGQPSLFQCHKFP